MFQPNTRIEIVIKVSLWFSIQACRTCLHLKKMTGQNKLETIPDQEYCIVGETTVVWVTSLNTTLQTIRNGTV